MAVDHPGEVRFLVLNKGEFKESVVYRVEKGIRLRFVLGPSLLGHRIRLFTNHPLSSNTSELITKSSEYRELEFVHVSKHKNDDLDRYAEFQLVKAGPFSYFFLLDTDCLDKSAGSGYFLVDPVLTVGANNAILPLDCIQCQTYLSKLLGPFPEWEGRLLVAKKSGYNMLHLTPVQLLGKSNSAYSIRNPLDLNVCFTVGEKKYGFHDLNALVSKMKTEWDVLTLTDVVWNHTAENSEWLKEHPECGYNLLNSPHLKPAYLLDRALKLFGNDVAADKWANRGLPTVICEEHHMNAMRSILHEEVLPPLRLHEFYQVDIDRVVHEFSEAMKKLSGPFDDSTACESQLAIIQDKEFRRLGSTVDLEVALRIYYRRWNGAINDVQVQERSIGHFRAKLLDLNNNAAGACWNHLSAAVDALLGHVRYERVSPFGPRCTDYTEHHLLFTEYFTHFEKDTDLVTEEKNMFDSTKNVFHIAHNGWVMNDEPLGNFAEPHRMVYLRRELICWGDSVKLNYGKCRDDCPFLWDLMTKYSEKMAEIFHGIRIDNCHSTPIHVAEYLLQKARVIRPDLYVVAELFTGSEHMDNLFVNRLGVTSLIREAMSAPDAHEEGRLVYKYGGFPVGAFIQPPLQPLKSIVAHAIFMDQTHDNPSPVEKRTVYDLLPSAALVSMACCASGSTRGYDELVPYHVNVVHEKRLYATWTDAEDVVGGHVGSTSGIIAGKAVLNQLHYNLGRSGFTEVFVDQLTEDTVAVTRHNPNTHQSVILVARTAFYRGLAKKITYIRPLQINGIVDDIILEAKLIRKSGTAGDVSSSGGEYSSTNAQRKSQKKKVVSEAEQKFILGLQEYKLQCREHLKLCAADLVEIHVREDGIHDVDFSDFPPGSVIAFRPSKQAILNIRMGLSNFGYKLRTLSGKNFEPGIQSAITLQKICEDISLADLNRILFRCHEEEDDDGYGGGVYNVPVTGPLLYCGLQGFISLLNEIRSNNDLGHPFCQNLRDGTWMCDYIAKRLSMDPRTKELGLWFTTEFNNMSLIPHYLRPSYFDGVLTGVYSELLDALFSKMSSFIRDGSDLIKALALNSVIFLGVSRSAPLAPLSSSLKPPLPPTRVDDATGEKKPLFTSLSAGLPHFATGLFRNWGRDTFISLPGLAIIPGRYDEARYIILSYAGTLRHGLVPNLLGEGSHARYNCRDAVWWWLHSIKLYCQLTPNGEQILNDSVLRLYPTDDAIAGTANKEEPLHATIQEALSRHFMGISYRERNAGKAIDEHMIDEGFNIEVGVDRETGFVFGGNQWNCGTWMDKMGSSHKAGNAGKPATPRDGSAVELVGLCFEVVHWLAELASTGKFSHKGVSATVSGKVITWTWAEWAAKIQQSFEANFWIPVSDSLAAIDAKYVNKRGIYKDSFRSQIPWTDYQLRPNFTIAISVAPELFDLDHAWTALNLAEELLLGPLGMKTLDPSDWAYDGFYDNSDDSHNFHRAKGFNYHQGPEWVWIASYFFRAKLTIADRLRPSKPQLFDEAVQSIQRKLSNHWTHLQQSGWRSLPELTNKDGAFCSHSCSAQAWSVACLMEVVFDMHRLAK